MLLPLAHFNVDLPLLFIPKETGTARCGLFRLLILKQICVLYSVYELS